MIKWLHVEASSRCNAWCPACPRNNSGYGLADGLVEEDLSTDIFANIIKQLPDLETVQFNGSYGDPIIAKNIIELIEIAKPRRIQIHTNGSLRTAKWWSELASILRDVEHNVWFGIDGLEDTHSIYRQGTDYNKIIENAQAFINNGGTATWQFIPYGHNEHQIIEALKTSQQLGFKNFKLAKFHRKETVVKHYRTGEPFILSAPKEFRPLLRIPSLGSKAINPVKEENCMHLNTSSIYLGANGKLSNCCYFRTAGAFDTLEELAYNQANLTHQICLDNCG